MTDQLIDVDSLESFIKDDPELLADLAVIFARSLPGSLSKLNVAAENHDVELLRETAHQLKGQISYFFAESLANQASELEEFGRTGNTESAGPAVDQVIAGVEQLLDELSQLTKLDLKLELE